MTTKEALKYINDQKWSESRPGLDRTIQLLAGLGNPQKKLNFIHVAGTNGKGSACAMLESVLRCAGYRTGLFTSPHLLRLNERIRVGGKEIEDEELAALTGRAREAAEGMEDHPSQFELVTAIAMLYFYQSRCDIVVLEAGMGGALDSTNVIEAPEIAVIMNIGLDHTEYLGGTLEKIAEAKAGIIKTGCTAVCYRGSPEVERVFERACREKNVRLIKTDFSDIKPLGHSLEGQSFSWRSYANISLPLLGEHQLKNAAVVLETLGALEDRGWDVNYRDIRRGLAETAWPARFEVLSRSPVFILDGGHNMQCAEEFVKNIKLYLPGRKMTFLFGVLGDKDYGGMLDLLMPCAREFICVTPDSPRALGSERLADYIRSRGGRANAFPSVEEGLVRAIESSGDRPAAAFGSLYMAGIIREKFPSLYKKHQRGSCLLARRALSPEKRAEYSRSIAGTIASSPAFRAAHTVMLYRAMPDEVDLSGLEAYGKRLVYPCCLSSHNMEARAPEPGCGWEKGLYGLEEPDRKASSVVAPEDIDLVICPCAGFDNNRNRLGMGAGYYDRFLPRCVKAVKFAAAFEAQRVNNVFCWEHDVRMDAVVTEFRII